MHVIQITLLLWKLTDDLRIFINGPFLEIFYEKESTIFVPFCLSAIPFWDVPKYCSVSKNKSH